MRILITILAATLLSAPLAPRAMSKEVSVEFFYETLDPYGDWLQTTDYGYVWHPKDVAEDWRPYTVGSWAYTDAGWTWVSEEPYGAITYHYGRWARLQDTGWVWVPDTEWAPAWVSWRRSDQYVGWAPLPPEATFKRDVGISSWSDSYYDIGPTQYSFVASRDFGQPQLSTVVLPRKQNVTIIRETKNITNITYSDRGIYNDGPQYDIVVRDSRTPIRRLRLERRDDVVFEGNHVRGDGMRASIAGDALRVFAPAIGFRSEAAPARVSRRVDTVNVDRGWRDVPQAQDLRVRIQQDTPRAPASLPQKPAFMRAAAALGLGATDDRSKRNLDAEGRPRSSREGGAVDQTRVPATETATPRTATAPEKNLRPEANPASVKPGTAEVRSPRVPPNRTMPAETVVRPSEDRAPGVPKTADPTAPDAPRAIKGVPPAAPREARPEVTTRPESAPEARIPKTAPAEVPRLRKEGGPEAIEPRRNEVKPPEGRGAREGGIEPKVTTLPSGETRPRTKESAPEAPRRPEAGPAAKPPVPVAAAAAAAAEAKGKKGEKEKEKDKDKGQ